MNTWSAVLLLACALAACGCRTPAPHGATRPAAREPSAAGSPTAHQDGKSARTARATSSHGDSAIAGGPSAPSRLTKRQVALLAGARKCIGYVYDAGYYAGGPPPAGRGACTDVVYFSLLAAGIDLQRAVNADIRRQPHGYPSLRDDNIDYRWAPDLVVWFRRHARTLPPDADWQAGDVVFWSLTDDGVSDHCGIVSDAMGAGQPLVIHNFPPACAENDVLHAWRVTGHFRAR